MNRPLTYLVGPEAARAGLPIGFLLGITVTFCSTNLLACYCEAFKR